ncbi:MAG TPA: EamA family transporter [Cyclobacteriaceae bacterium]|nr:EamA family transporter [Cyclobacteriaceae bacterium]
MYALLSALFAALTAILAKVGVRNIDSDLATGVRTVVILVLVWTIVIAKGATKFASITKQNFLFLFLSGLATGASWLFYFKALQVGNVSQVAPVDKLSIALTLILSVVFLHESLSLKTAVGAAMIIAGVLLVIN